MLSQNRIIELSRLEKTFKSNHQPHLLSLVTESRPFSAMSASLKYFLGWGLHHCSGQPVPILDLLFHECIFPSIQSKLSLEQLGTIMKTTQDLTLWFPLGLVNTALNTKPWHIFHPVGNWARIMSLYLYNTFFKSFNDFLPANLEPERLVSVSGGIKLLSIL